MMNDEGVDTVSASRVHIDFLRNQRNRLQVEMDQLEKQIANLNCQIQSSERNYSQRLLQVAERRRDMNRRRIIAAIRRLARFVKSREIYAELARDGVDVGTIRQVRKYLKSIAESGAITEGRICSPGEKLVYGLTSWVTQDSDGHRSVSRKYQPSQYDGKIWLTDPSN